MGSSIVTAAQNRFFNGQAWTYGAPSSNIGAYDGSVTITQTTKFGTVTGPAIDCSHFVMETMLAAGYNVTEVTSGQMASIARGGSSSLYSAVASADIQPGNVVVFSGHVGIVTSYNPDTGIGTYDGAQSPSTGLAQNVLFTTNPGTPPQNLTYTNPVTGTTSTGFLYSGTTKEGYIGATQPTANAYNPASAAQVLDTINGYINQGLTNSGLAPYFSPANTNGTPVVGGDTFGGGDDPGEDSDGTTGATPWFESTVTTTAGNTTTVVQGFNSSNTQVSALTISGLTTAPAFDASGNLVATFPVGSGTATVALNPTTGAAVNGPTAPTAVVNGQTITLLGTGGSSPFALISNDNTGSDASASSSITR